VRNENQADPVCLKWEPVDTASLLKGKKGIGNRQVGPKRAAASLTTVWGGRELDGRTRFGGDHRFARGDERGELSKIKKGKKVGCEKSRTKPEVA